ncbi:MAG: aminopeptidase N, partial [Stackebrandtia sp.]
MAETRILTQTDATERARLLDVESYDVRLDLTTGDKTFISESTVRFTCTEPGAETFIEIAAESISSATINGESIDVSSYVSKQGLALPALAADNVLTVTAVCQYSSSGQGLHRMTDRVDGESYLYTQFEISDAQQMYACFDQPDLKARFTLHVTMPKHWTASSNMPIEAETADGDVTTIRFATAPKMSTYITALCAGPYHVVTDSHAGIELGLYCRQSMKQYLD